MAFDKTVPTNFTLGDADPICENFNRLADHHYGAVAPAAPELGWIWIDNSDPANVVRKVYTQDGVNPAVWVIDAYHLEAIPTPPSHAIAGDVHSASTLAQLNAKVSDDDLQGTTAKGAINGYAGLDGSGDVPIAQMQASVIARGVTLRTESTVAVVVGNKKIYVVCPFACTIKRWYLTADPATSCVLDIWKANGALPTILNTITAAAKPALVASTYATSAVLTAWTTAVAKGDIFELNVDSNDLATAITLVLEVELA